MSNTKTVLIGCDEAVRAMRFCEKAGIDITKKGIWLDQEMLIKCVGTGELGEWLRKHR